MIAATIVATGHVARADAIDRCETGQAPVFGTGFGALQDQLGAAMGIPTTCEYPDPEETGDVEQNTTTGLAFWRKSTNTPTFTSGFDHWALTSGGITHWAGSSVDPPSDPATVGTFMPFAGIWVGHGRALEVRSDGAVLITYRTYRVCGQEPPPCDSVTDHAITDGGRITVQLESGAPSMAVGSVVSSSDPTYPAGTTAALTLDAHDAMNVRIGERAFGNFCGRTSPVGYCGA